MKQLICGFLCLILCCSLSGCLEDEIPIAEPVEFFYLRDTFSYTDSDTAIGSEQRESAGHKEDIHYLLDLYFSGPQSDTLAKTFPTGCSLVSYSTRGNTITVVITDAFASLTGIDLSVASVCLAKTLTGFSGFQTVIIRPQTQLLDGKKSITVRNEDFVLFDDYTAPMQTE